MPSKPRCFAILLLLVLNAASARAATGGSDEGGGSVARCGRQERPFLLDRLSLNPLFARADRVPTLEASAPTIPQERQAEISTLFASDAEAFRFAFKRLAEWEKRLPAEAKLSKALMQLLMKSLQTTSYKRTTHRFNVLSRFHLSAELKKQCQLETAILYLPAYGCLISAPIWDKLDVETQAGLLIHEGFRQLQGLYALTDLTDEQLQKLTALIMDRTPSDTTLLERAMSEELRSRCALAASAGEACANCGAEEVRSSRQVDLLFEKLVDQGRRDVESLRTQFQKERSETLESPAALKVLLKQLLEQGVLKP